VRQKPGSAKGVTFLAIEDDTNVANIVIWSALFEKQRRLILSPGLIGCQGKLQREGEVTHLIAEHFLDLSDLLRSVANRDAPCSTPMEMRHAVERRRHHGRAERTLQRVRRASRTLKRRCFRFQLATSAEARAPRKSRVGLPSYHQSVATSGKCREQHLHEEPNKLLVAMKGPETRAIVGMP